MNRSLIIGSVLFLLGQAGVWYQTNGQFISVWAKKHPQFMMLLGLPISLTFIYATSYIVKGFEGELWPGRLVGFATGMVVFSILTYVHRGEPITIKTLITLLLALTIVCIQVFWKS